MAINPTMYSSSNNDWETPDAFFNSLNSVFQFNKDLAATKGNAKCSVFVSSRSLERDWHSYHGWLWLNPPYGRNITGKWVKKCDEEAQKGAKIVALLPARTDTKFFHKHILGKYPIWFIGGRLKFKGAASSAPFPSMIVVFSKKPNGKLKKAAGKFKAKLLAEKYFV